MYETFYELSSKPFQLNPDPSFYYASKQHRRAKAYLDYGVLRNEGFVVITGEIGAGKTTILRALLDSLNRGSVVVGNLVTTQLDADDILRMVGAAFGFNVADVPKSSLLITLEAFLISQASQGKRCLLVVDEAQNLTPRAVEELRMLSNFQLGNQSLLQSFLVGQPEFREMLQSPEMEQFRQRVSATCHLGPLDLEETQHYIEHRLKCAGYAGKPTFDPEAFKVIYRASHGIPRRINSVCDRLFLLGFLGNKFHFTAEDVDEVVREFAHEAEVPMRNGSAAHTGAMKLNGEGTSNGVAVRDDASDAADLSHIELPQGEIEAMSRRLSRLGDVQQGDRLRRLERSLLRLEHINLQTLSMLQRLVQGVTPAGEEESQ